MIFIRTTIVGGFVFLLPLVVIIVVLGKAYGIMLHMAKPLGRLLPVDSVAGIAVAEILALLAVLIVCFIAGLAARSKLARRAYRRIDSGLLAIPGYAFVKGFADHLQMEEDQTHSLQPVLVQFDDNAQLGFEIERLEGGDVVVYLPGAPDPWSGSVGYFAEGRIRPLAMTVPQAVGHIRRLGRGSDLVAKALREAKI
ncbi:DUF502 domain-containing protein [Marinobacter nanhaiticus D15-8W]|nr:DUF502 domain-containing protein [Marinobacter nanhaiticus]BES73156.1 DUF502 domain-containing protein [Marinobacter nanhaiticus D15-8W]